MLKVTLALVVVLAFFAAESSCQNIILPTYRPPVRSRGPTIILPTYRPPRSKPVIRYVREVGDLEPFISEDDAVLPTENPRREPRSVDSPSAKRGGGSHSTSSSSRDTGPTHPGYNRRNARSLDSPSAKRGGGSSRTSSGSRNTGATHPGYNRRNAREIRLPGHLNPLRPKPLYPRPTFPAPVPRIPILARTARDIQIPGIKKPTHRDVIIPNWNPHVKTNPWDRIGGRHRRSVDDTEDTMTNEELETITHGREVRDIHVSGFPELKKPSHRDVIIPNWNPHVKTNPWSRIGGRHRRSLDDPEDTMTNEEFETITHGREVRDIHVSGFPDLKKQSHRDVIIPNWNPNVRTNPWDSLGGGRRH